MNESPSHLPNIKHPESKAAALLLVTLALIALLRRVAPAALRPATVAATYLIGTISSFWFIERMLA